MHLGFEEVDVLLFVLEESDEQVAGTVITFGGGEIESTDRARLAPNAMATRRSDHQAIKCVPS